MLHSGAQYELLAANQAPAEWRALGPLPHGPGDRHWPQDNYLVDRSPDEIAIIHNNFLDFRRELIQTVVEDDQMISEHTTWGGRPVADLPFLRARITNNAQRTSAHLAWSGDQSGAIEEVLLTQRTEAPEAMMALGKIIGETLLGKTVFGNDVSRVRVKPRNELHIILEKFINFGEQGSFATNRGVPAAPPQCTLHLPRLFAKHPFEYVPLHDRFEATNVAIPTGTGQLSRTEFFAIMRGISHLARIHQNH